MSARLQWVTSLGRHCRHSAGWANSGWVIDFQKPMNLPGRTDGNLVASTILDTSYPIRDGAGAGHAATAESSISSTK